MTIFRRSDLQKVFPDNPRAVASFERMDKLLSHVDDKGRSLFDRIDEILAAIGDNSRFQTASPLLDALAALPNRIGVPEITKEGEANVRPIDGQDPASLITRGGGYGVYVGIAGSGPTASRPVLPDGYVAIYFDTDIDPDGQPIIRRTDGVWLNMNGVPV
jgi:hypothetical protein